MMIGVFLVAGCSDDTGSGTAFTTMRLDPSQGETVGCPWQNAPDVATEIYIVADVIVEEGMIINRNTECFELNNWSVVSVDACR
jgi:hypothetical protein